MQTLNQHVALIHAFVREAGRLASQDIPKDCSKETLAAYLLERKRMCNALDGFVFPVDERSLARALVKELDQQIAALCRDPLSATSAEIDEHHAAGRR